MNVKDIYFVDEQLRSVPGMTDMFRESIVEGLRKGQIWQDRFELMKRNINRVIEIGFFKHYTVENILNLINNIETTCPLYNDGGEDKPQEGLSVIDKMVLDGIKKFANSFFDIIERQLEKE